MKKDIIGKGDDFIHECVFESQLNYVHIADNFYLVNMQSGKTAVYERQSEGYYGGTGQRDFIFTFLHYASEGED